MLILFDIDGTLLLSCHAGIKAMRDATSEMVGGEVDFDVDTAGRLDPLIWSDVARRNGIDEPHVHHDRFREMYTRHLRDRLERDKPSYALDGVPQLIDGLRGFDPLTLGLLTGNYAETGRMKIEAAGLDPDVFSVAAWGTDGPQRRDLPPVAMTRYAEHKGEEVAPERVVIIGDTPHDVDCAHHNGCRVIAVATGRFSLDELRACDADLTVEDLADTDMLVSWITEQVGCQV